MFGFKKKSNIVNNIFGEMTYLCGWESVNPIKMTLWGVEYYIGVVATALNNKVGITYEQEKAYTDYLSTIEEKQHTIEKVIEEHFPDLNIDELASRFLPEELMFCRNGDYGICIGDRNDADCAIQPDSGLAIGFVPELHYYESQEEYLWPMD